MLDGVSHGMRAFADKVGVNCSRQKIRLARRFRRPWRFCVIRVLTLDANAPVSEPKMAASAEIVAGVRDPPINLMVVP